MDNFDFVTFDWRKEKWPAEMMENKNNNSAENEDFLESISIQREGRGNISKNGNFYSTLVVN